MYALIYSSELDLHTHVVLDPISFFFSFFFPFFPFSILLFHFYFLFIWVWLLELIRYSESVFFLPVRGQQLVVENLSLLYILAILCPLLCRPLSDIREGASKSGEMARSRMDPKRERDIHWFHSSSLRIENKKMKSIVLCQFLRRPEGQKSRSVHSLLAIAQHTHTSPLYNNTDGA